MLQNTWYKWIATRYLDLENTWYKKKVDNSSQCFLNPNLQLTDSLPSDWIGSGRRGSRVWIDVGLDQEFLHMAI